MNESVESVRCIAIKNKNKNNGQSQKIEILGKRGAYVKFPPWWDYGYFLELHNPVVKLYLKHVRVEDMIY